MKAIVLVSGGLDSCLAALLLKDQGIEVVPVNFQIPFCQESGGRASCGDASRIAGLLGIDLKVLHLGDEFIDMVANPRHGRGRNMNPCIDCRIMMLRRAAALLEPEGASFVATGEVLGQRPLSQHLRALELIDRESGIPGLILRPLSAQALSPTVPEREGWVDRGRLLALRGRSRREQFALARRYGIKDPPTPAGGCLLTDPAYSKRLKDVLDHRGSLTVHLAALLRHGRYFRLSPGAMLVVGRNEKDNANLEALREGGEWLLRPVNCVGPTAVGTGEFDDGLLERAVSLVARYSDAPADGMVEVEVGGRDDGVRRISARREK